MIWYEEKIPIKKYEESWLDNSYMIEEITMKKFIIKNKKQIFYFYLLFTSMIFF
jgi:hypothetical protein